MKSISLFVLFVLFSINCFAKELEKLPVRTDFNDVTVVGDTIIAFGGNGMCHISLDDGKSWKRNQIYEAEVITQVIIKNNLFYAFGVSGRVAVSRDLGDSWQTVYKFPDSLFSIVTAGENYMVRAKGKIFICDSNYTTLFEKANDQQSDLNIYYTSEGERYLTGTFHTTSVFCNNKYYFSIDSSKILEINGDFSTEFVHDISVMDKSFYKDMYYTIYTNGEKFYVNVPYKFIKDSAHSTTYNKLLSTSDFKNYDTIYNEKLENVVSTLIKNNAIYFLTLDKKSTNQIQYYNVSNIYNKDSLNKIYTFSIIYDKGSKKGYFDSEKSVIVGNNNLIHIYHNGNSEPTFYSHLLGNGISMSPDYVNDSTLIFYKGNYKGKFIINNCKTENYGLSYTPLFIPYDTFTNWLSRDDLYYKYFEPETKKLFFYSDDVNFSLYSNFDDFKTFKGVHLGSDIKKDIEPNIPYIKRCKDKNYAKYILPLVYNGYPNGTGSVIEYVFFDDSLNYDKSLREKKKEVDYIYFKDSSTFVMHYYDENDNNRYIAYSTDKTKTWNPIKGFDLDYIPLHTKEISFKGKDYFIMFYHHQPTTKNLVYMVDLDSYSISELTSFTYEQSSQNLSPTAVDSDGEFIYLAIRDTLFTISNPYDKASWSYELFTNNGRVYQTLKKFNDKFIGQYVEDNFFYTFHPIQYWFSFQDNATVYPSYISEDYDFGKRDTSENTSIKKAFRLTNSSPEVELVIYGVSALKGFSSSIPADFWRKGLRLKPGEFYEFDVEFFPKEVKIFEENLIFYANVEGGEIRFNLKGEGTAITSVDEIEERDYLYVMFPYPQPAVNVIKTFIYWDSGKRLNPSDIEIYDLSGAKLDIRSKLSIEPQNAYSGLLIWDCTGVENGIYLININHGTENRTIKVAVGK